MSTAETAPSGRVPDGGYGCVISVVGALIAIVSTQNLGITGVLMVELMEYFDCSKAAMSWLSAIVLFMYVTAVGNAVLFKRHGIRKVGLVWSAIGSVGLVISSLATHLWMLYISFGVITGSALVCYNLAAVLVMPMWFEKHLALAMSVMFTGSALGVFVWPPLTSYLIAQYSWRGTMLLMAGAHLNCFVLFALIRPPATPPSHKATTCVIGKDDNQLHHISDEKPLPIRPLLPPQQQGQVSRQQGSQFIGGEKMCDIANQEKVVDDCISSRHASTISLQGSCDSRDVDNICEDYNGDAKDEFEINELSQKDCPVSEPCTIANRHGLWSQPVLYAFILATILVHIGWFVPYTFLPIRAEEHLFSKTQGALLVTVMGIATMIVRPVCGYLGDKFRRKRVLLYNTYHLAAGLTTILSCMSNLYASLCVYSAAFAIITGGAGVLLIVVVIDLFGRENLDLLVSVVSVCIAFSGLTGNLIAGAVTDATGRVSAAFLAVGAIHVSGALMGLLAYVVIYRQQNSPCPRLNKIR